MRRILNINFAGGKLKRLLFFILTLMVIVSGSYFVFAKNDTKAEAKGSDSLMRDLYILNEGVRYIHDYYFKKIPSSDMVHDMLSSYMNTLDPHTNFIGKQASKEMKMQLNGKYGGVGIVIGLRDEKLIVVSPFEDTPAFRAGLKPLDRILKVDGVNTDTLKLDEVADKIRGPIGTKVTLQISRKDVKKPFDVVLTREEIKLKTVKTTMIDKNIGYMRISSFNGDTSNEVRKSITDLLSKKPHSLIIDLRNNPGGLLSEAVNVSNFFLDKGKLIVYTKGRLPSISEKYYSKDNPLIKKIPIIVMVNQGSASGAEILAGALRDNKRAILLGMQSYGKGSVQNIFTLSDGSSMKITIAKYFTPSGVCIDGKGLTPDIKVPLKAPEDLMEKLKQEAERANNTGGTVEVTKKVNKKNVTDKEKIKEKKDENNIVDLENDYQLKRALEFIKVYKILAQN